MTKRTFYIYTLTNPITNKVFYVGGTQNPMRRENHHRAKNNSCVGVYCSKHGIKPIFTIIDKLSGYGILSAETLEAKWINRFISEGVELVNTRHNNKQRHRSAA